MALIILHCCICKSPIVFQLSCMPFLPCRLLTGMYRIAIVKIRPEPDSTGYQMNYPTRTGTRYLNTCCIANFSVLYVVWIREYYSPCLLFSALCETAQVYDYKRVSRHDSLTTRIQVTSSLNALTLASIALSILALSDVSQTSTVDNAQ